MATAVLRSRSVDSAIFCKETDTLLAENVVKPAFEEPLENFMHKAQNSSDRAKCGELIHALELSKYITEQNLRLPCPPPKEQKRPKTAMGSADKYSRLYATDYTTSYKNHFPSKYGQSAQAERPPSTQYAFQRPYDLPEAIGETHYDDVFAEKTLKRMPPERSGSASGTRNNNPHPSKAFMIWKYPKKGIPEKPYSQWAHALTNELMDKICRGNLKTTYQKDYIGIPQGHQMDSAFSDVKDWKGNVPYTLDSSTRKTYQQPEPLPAELTVSKTRYGENKRKNAYAKGIVPLGYTTQYGLKPRTTYEKEYHDPVAPRRREFSPVIPYEGQQLPRKEYSSYTELPPQHRQRSSARTPAATPLSAASGRVSISTSKGSAFSMNYEPYRYGGGENVPTPFRSEGTFEIYPDAIRY